MPIKIETVLCTECGSEVYERQGFCRECGTEIETQEDESESEGE